MRARLDGPAGTVVRRATGPSSAPPAVRRDGSVGGDPPAAVWFVAEVPFRVGGLPENTWTVAQVAARTRRDPKAIAQAVRTGRIQRATVAGRSGVFVRATPQQLARWRRCSLEEVLAGRPDLPQASDEWLDVADVARRLGLSYQVAEWRLEHLAVVAFLEWGGGTPFRRERRWHLPTLPAALARPLRGGRRLGAR